MYATCPIYSILLDVITLISNKLFQLLVNSSPRLIELSSETRSDYVLCSVRGTNTKIQRSAVNLHC